MTICFPRSLTLPQVVHFVCTGLSTSFILSWQLLLGKRLHFTCTLEFYQLPFSRSHISIQTKVRKTRMGRVQLFFSSSYLFVGLHLLEQKNTAQLWTLNSKRQSSWGTEYRKGKLPFLCMSLQFGGIWVGAPHSRTKNCAHWGNNEV